MKKLPCFSITSGGILEVFDCCAAAAVVRAETANDNPKINEVSLRISEDLTPSSYGCGNSNALLCTRKMNLNLHNLLLTRVCEKDFEHDLRG
jgi:hypothetical protein